MKLTALKKINGELQIPGDKSISHRAVMFGALSNGTTVIHNFLTGADCLSTIRCFKALGINIDLNESLKTVTVHGGDFMGFQNQRLHWM